MKIHIINERDSLWLSVADYAETCSWDACARMAIAMRAGKFNDWEKLFVAKENGVFMGFCALLKPPNYSGQENSPLIKWLFVEEKYRGQRLSQKLIDTAAEYAKKLGYKKICLTTWHEGLYEKFGFVKMYEQEMRNGHVEGIYEREI
jgi:predicted N-acetyltransferase YhbS